MKIMKIYDDAILPTRGSAEAAGYDLYARLKEHETLQILPHQTTKIGTGIAIECPKGYFAGIFARSGLATKHGLRPANCVGVCDADYRGEYIVALHNDTDHAVGISEGERIAQMVLMPFIPMEFEKVTELSDTVRGEGGFGSTGSK